MAAANGEAVPTLTTSSTAVTLERFDHIGLTGQTVGSLTFTNKTIEWRSSRTDSHKIILVSLVIMRIAGGCDGFGQVKYEEDV